MVRQNETTVAGGVPVAQADDKEEARELLAQGDRFLEKGEKRRDKGREQRALHYFGKALDAYQRAYTLVPKPSIYYAIANAEVRLGRYKEAIAHYQAVIKDVDNEALVGLAKERLVELAPKIATVVMTIAPEGAELSIDNELLGVAPIADPIMLMPGKHTFTITLDGHTPNEFTVELDEGSLTKREVTLEKNTVLVKKPRDDNDKEKPEFHVPGSTVKKKPGKGRLILGGVLTGGLLAAAGVTGYLGLSADEGEGTPLVITGITAGVLGLAVGAYTTYYYLGVYRPRKKAFEKTASWHRVPKIWVTPYVHAEGGGMAVGGRF